MTLMEVMVALAIVTTVLLGFGAFLGRFMHTSSIGTISSAASDIAVSQIEAAKAFPTYATLDATFNGTTTPFPNCASCTRTTLVAQTNTATQDYKTVTVTVTSPNLTSSVTKTTTIAAF
jgi:type II secretory pathway pseudopilin PulG